MPNVVPQDDLPANLAGQAVPQGDMPDSFTPKKARALPSKPPSWGDAILGTAKRVALFNNPIAISARLPALLDKAIYEAGGKVTDLASKAGASPEVSAGVGTATNALLNAVPMIAGGEAAKTASPWFKDMGRMLMQSALKPGKRALETGKGTGAVETLLKEGINVTPGGVEKLRGMIDDLNNEIQGQIKNSAAKIDKAAVAKYADDVIEKFKMQVTPQADMKTIASQVRQFLANPLFNGNKQIPVQLAQKIKQGTYRALGSKVYGEMKGAEVETQKALARGLKDQIAKAVPGIDKLNKKESELLNAQSLAVSRVLMDSNKNPLGLGWLAMHPETWLGFAADRSPFIKSLLARAFYSGSKQIPATMARVAIPALDSLSNTIQPPQDQGMGGQAGMSPVDTQQLRPDQLPINEIYGVRG